MEGPVASRRSAAASSARSGVGQGSGATSRTRTLSATATATAATAARTGVRDLPSPLSLASAPARAPGLAARRTSKPRASEATDGEPERCARVSVRGRSPARPPLRPALAPASEVRAEATPDPARHTHDAHVCPSEPDADPLPVLYTGPSTPTSTPPASERAAAVRPIVTEAWTRAMVRPEEEYLLYTRAGGLGGASGRSGGSRRAVDAAAQGLRRNGYPLAAAPAVGRVLEAEARRRQAATLVAAERRSRALAGVHLRRGSRARLTDPAATPAAMWTPSSTRAGESSTYGGGRESRGGRSFSPGRDVSMASTAATQLTHPTTAREPSPPPTSRSLLLAEGTTAAGRSSAHTPPPPTPRPTRWEGDRASVEKAPAATRSHARVLFREPSVTEQWAGRGGAGHTRGTRVDGFDDELTPAPSEQQQRQQQHEEEPRSTEGDRTVVAHEYERMLHLRASLLSRLANAPGGRVSTEAYPRPSESGRGGGGRAHRVVSFLPPTPAAMAVSSSEATPAVAAAKSSSILASSILYPGPGARPAVWSGDVGRDGAAAVTTPSAAAAAPRVSAGARRRPSIAVSVSLDSLRPLVVVAAEAAAADQAQQQQQQTQGLELGSGAGIDTLDGLDGLDSLDDATRRLLQDPMFPLTSAESLARLLLYDTECEARKRVGDQRALLAFYAASGSPLPPSLLSSPTPSPSSSVGSGAVRDPRMATTTGVEGGSRGLVHDRDRPVARGVQAKTPGTRSTTTTLPSTDPGRRAGAQAHKETRDAAAARPILLSGKRPAPARGGGGAVAAPSPHPSHPSPHPHPRETPAAGGGVVHTTPRAAATVTALGLERDGSPDSSVSSAVQGMAGGPRRRVSLGGEGGGGGSSRTSPTRSPVCAPAPAPAAHLLVSAVMPSAKTATVPPLSTSSVGYLGGGAAAGVSAVGGGGGGGGGTSPRAPAVASAVRSRANSISAAPAPPRPSAYDRAAEERLLRDMAHLMGSATAPGPEARAGTGSSTIAASSRELTEFLVAYRRELLREGHLLSPEPTGTASGAKEEEEALDSSAAAPFLAALRQAIGMTDVGAVPARGRTERVDEADTGAGLESGEAAVQPRQRRRRRLIEKSRDSTAPSAVSCAGESAGDCTESSHSRSDSDVEEVVAEEEEEGAGLLATLDDSSSHLRNVRSTLNLFGAFMTSPTAGVASRDVVERVMTMARRRGGQAGGAEGAEQSLFASLLHLGQSAEAAEKLQGMELMFTPPPTSA